MSCFERTFHDVIENKSDTLSLTKNAVQDIVRRKLDVDYTENNSITATYNVISETRL
jgi:hypothetical protein